MLLHLLLLLVLWLILLLWSLRLDPRREVPILLKWSLAIHLVAYSLYRNRNSCPCKSFNGLQVIQIIRASLSVHNRWLFQKGLLLKKLSLRVTSYKLLLLSIRSGYFLLLVKIRLKRVGFCILSVSTRLSLHFHTVKSLSCLAWLRLVSLSLASRESELHIILILTLSWCHGSLSWLSNAHSLLVMYRWTLLLKERSRSDNTIITWALLFLWNYRRREESISNSVRSDDVCIGIVLVLIYLDASLRRIRDSSPLLNLWRRSIDQIGFHSTWIHKLRLWDFSLIESLTTTSVFEWFFIWNLCLKYLIN